MALKQDLMKALVEAKKVDYEIIDPERDTSEMKASPAMVKQAELMTEAIANFLTKCEFRITELRGNVIVEDFKIPPQPADIQSGVKSTDTPYPGGSPAPSLQLPLVNTKFSEISAGGGGGGALLRRLNLNKDFDGLQSTGYVYIGVDPENQENFDLSDEDGLKENTSVRLYRDEIEDLLYGKEEEA